jgi:hypothetical protein
VTSGHEVAAILNRVNNWRRLCGNVVRLDSTGVGVRGCLRISEHFLTPRQECSGAEHFSRVTCICTRAANSVMGWSNYFDESFRQLTTATTIPISAVIGPVMDQVVVLLIWLPPSTPNPWSAQIRPNSARIKPTANVATKVLLIQGSYARFGQLLAKNVGR